MVSKTIELRKVIISLLNQTNKEVYYENASDTALLPYIVYELENVNFGNTGRDDIILTIDIWDKNLDSTNIEILADQVEKLFDGTNNPTSTVLPTFYAVGRYSRPDEDKTIRRRELRFQIQNYYIGA